MSINTFYTDLKLWLILIFQILKSELLKFYSEPEILHWTGWSFRSLGLGAPTLPVAIVTLYLAGSDDDLKVKPFIKSRLMIFGGIAFELCSPIMKKTEKNKNRCKLVLKIALFDEANVLIFYLNINSTFLLKFSKYLRCICSIFCHIINVVQERHFPNQDLIFPRWCLPDRLESDFFSFLYHLFSTISIVLIIVYILNFNPAGVVIFIILLY